MRRLSGVNAKGHRPKEQGRKTRERDMDRDIEGEGTQPTKDKDQKQRRNTERGENKSPAFLPRAFDLSVFCFSSSFLCQSNLNLSGRRLPKQNAQPHTFTLFQFCLLPCAASFDCSSTATTLLAKLCESINHLSYLQPSIHYTRKKTKENI